MKKVKRNVNTEIKKLEKSEIIEPEPRRNRKSKKERYYNDEYSKRNIVLKKVKRNVNTEIKKLEKSEIIEPEPRRNRKSKKER